MVFSSSIQFHPVPEAVPSSWKVHDSFGGRIHRHVGLELGPEEQVAERHPAFEVEAETNLPQAPGVDTWKEDL